MNVDILFKIAYYNVDVIADDKKLIEIYIAVVKEMSVKYGVDLQKAA